MSKEDVVIKGLAQMDAPALKRIIKHIDDKKPICLSGDIFDKNGAG